MLRVVLINLAFAIVVLSSPTRIRNQKRQNSPLLAIAAAFNVNIDPHRITNEQAQLLTKMQSYCSCLCCQEQVPTSGLIQTCDRLHPAELPSDFQCPQQFCAHKTVENCHTWNQTKCDRTCYCERCGDSDAERCSEEQHTLTPGPACRCPTPEFAPACGHPRSPLPDRLSRDNMQCVMSCFCRLCTVRYMRLWIPGVLDLCSSNNHLKIPKTQCDCPACPSIDSVLQARQQLMNGSIDFRSAGSR